jgi:hypothetical protein
MLSFTSQSLICVLSVPGKRDDPCPFNHRADKDQCLPFNSLVLWGLDLQGDLRHRDSYVNRRQQVRTTRRKTG